MHTKVIFSTSAGTPGTVLVSGLPNLMIGNQSPGFL